MFTTIKVLFFAVVFIITGGKIFSEYFRKNRILLLIIALLSAISFYYLIEKFYYGISNHMPTSITTFKSNDEKQSGWDTRVDSSVTSTVKTYLDQNYPGWTLANSKQCLNNDDAHDPVQLYGDFDGDGTFDFAIRIHHGMELYLFSFLSSGSVHMLEREFGDVANPLTLMKKGTRDYDYKNNQRVLLSNDGITVNICEKSAWTYVYIDGKFKRLWTSD